MRTLSLIRHAKSSWDYPELNDFDRPIRNKGIRRTRKVCGYLSAHEIIPELIVSSNAVRALRTAELVCENLFLSKEIIHNIDSFYPGGTQVFEKEIAKVNIELKHIMLVGHNPGITDFLNHLVVNKFIDWVPTSGVAVLTNESSTWANLQPNAWELQHYVIPKQILNDF